jgi:hypothetical protein
MGRKLLDEGEYEHRLRLFLLTCEVLRDMETADEAASVSIFTLLSRAFFDDTMTPVLGALLHSRQQAGKPPG